MILEQRGWSGQVGEIRVDLVNDVVEVEVVGVVVVQVRVASAAVSESS